MFFPGKHRDGPCALSELASVFGQFKGLAFPFVEPLESVRSTRALVMQPSAATAWRGPGAESALGPAG